MYESLLLIYGFVGLIICIILGAITGNVGKKKGYSYGAFFALGFFLTVIGLIIALVMEDKNAKASPAVDAADSLIKYKRLLDDGAISKEEFDKKKSELLNGEIAVRNPINEERSIGESASSIANSEKKDGLRIVILALAAIAGIMQLMGLLSLINAGIVLEDVFYYVFQANLLRFMVDAVCVIAAIFCILSAIKLSKQLVSIAIGLSVLAVLLAFVRIATLVGVPGATIMTFVMILCYPVLLVIASALAMKSYSK